MAILLQPDSLSFASNLKKFVISSAEEIRFKLLLGETLLIDESYSPDASGKIEIDVKEVVISQLGFSIPTTDSFEQTSILKLFTAQIDEAIITFTALRAGVENLSDVPSDFLTDNWLTWQPQTKQTSYNQPEWLTYYSTVPVTIKVKFYMSDNTTQIITLANQAAGKCVTYNMQFAHIMSLQAGSKFGYFDVWAENAGGARLNYIQRYIYQDLGLLDEFFLAENSLGGIDTVVMSGDSVALPEVENIEALFDEESIQLDGSHTRIISKNTGWKSKLEAQWLWDFFSSKNRYKLQDGAIKKISIRESDIQNSFQDDLKSFTFKYRLSADKGLLNIPRSADPLPENLEITTPEGLFFLAPRLVEFPSAEFVDEFLLPVQSPYLQEWKKITLGVIKGTILDYIRSQISPGIPQSLLDLSDIDPSLETANVGAYMVKLASGKWGPGSVSIDLSNYFNKGESDERYSFKSHSHDYVPTATFNSHAGDSVKHTTQEDKDKIIAAYNDKHTHNNKANLDTINQDLSKSSSVEFADLVSAGSVAFYGGTGGGSTPASSLLNLSDIDSSLATAAVGSPLVKLANGKWGPGSVSIDLTNYFTKEESDARFAFKAHGHDYVAPTAFNAHTGDTTKHITSAERVAWNAKESALGNPDVDGKILASTAGGVRSWVNRYVLPVAAAAMLGGVMIGANVNVDAQGRISVAAPYSHPATHPASMIDESATRRFLTDTERANWNDSYDKRHTHGNKANLDSINQNLSQTSNVKFNDVIADGSLSFYGGVGSGSTPVASLLDLSDIDASISAAATGTPLVKLANGKWGAGSVSIDLSNYYNKSDADARYAFKSHSHDYVTTSVFNGHNHNGTYALLAGSSSQDFFANNLTVNRADSDSVYMGSSVWLGQTYIGLRAGIDKSFNIDTYNSGSNLNALKIFQSGLTTITSTHYDPLRINNISATPQSAIEFQLSGITKAYIGYNGGIGAFLQNGISPYGTLGILNDTTPYYSSNGGSTRHILLHASNYSSYALPLSGGILTNKITFNYSNGTYVSSSKMEDMLGWNDNYGTYIGSNVNGYNEWIYGNGKFYSNGTIHTLIHSGNIGSQSVNYAAYTGNLSTLSKNEDSIVNYDTNAWHNWSQFSTPLPGDYKYGLHIGSPDANYNFQVGMSAGSTSVYLRTKNVSYNAWQKIWTDGNLTNTLSNGYLSYWNGSSLVNSAITFNGTITTISKGSLGDVVDIYANGAYAGITLTKSNQKWALISGNNGGSDFSIEDRTGGLTGVASPFTIQGITGNVGIGYTGRSEKLAVKGDGYFNGALSQSANGLIHYAKGTSTYEVYLSFENYAGYFARYGVSANNEYAFYNTTQPKYSWFFGSLGEKAYLTSLGAFYAASYIETASYLKGTSVKLGTWEIKENASGELEFIQSGVLKFKGTAAGLISQGELGFYS